MANNKSAEKRIRINKRNRLQNRYYRSSVKTLIKMFLKDLGAYKISQGLDDKKIAHSKLNLAYSLIDKSSKRNVFHKNTAARKKSKLAAQLKLV